MSPTTTILLVIGALFVLVQQGAGSRNRDRVRRYMTERGEELLSIEWKPFGPGWWCTLYARIYRVEYRGTDGSTHRAYCRTGAFAGVVLTEDSVEEDTEPFSPGERLEADRRHEEIRRLRDDLRARVHDIPR